MPALEFGERPATAAEMNALMVRWWNTAHPDHPLWDITDCGPLTWEEAYNDCQGAD